VGYLNKQNVNKVTKIHFGTVNKELAVVSSGADYDRWKLCMGTYILTGDISANTNYNWFYFIGLSNNVRVFFADGTNIFTPANLNKENNLIITDNSNVEIYVEEGARICALSGRAFTGRGLKPRIITGGEITGAMPLYGDTECHDKIYGEPRIYTVGSMVRGGSVVHIDIYNGGEFIAEGTTLPLGCNIRANIYGDPTITAGNGFVFGNYNDVATPIVVNIYGNPQITSTNNVAINSNAAGHVAIYGNPTITANSSYAAYNAASPDAKLTITGNPTFTGTLNLYGNTDNNVIERAEPLTHGYTVELKDSNAVNGSVFKLTGSANKTELAKKFTMAGASSAFTVGVGGGGDGYLVLKHPLADPTPTLPTNTFTYDGNSKTPTLTEFNDGTMTKSGDTQGTVAGNYGLIVGVKAANTVWTDSRVSQVTFPWVINKAELTQPTLQGGTAFTYNGTEQGIEINGVTANMTLNGSRRTDAGEYTATVVIKDTANYKWSGVSGANESSPLSFPWVINKAVLTKPILTSGTAFTYNGTEQGIEISGFVAATMKLSGYTQRTNAGEYTVTVTLNSPNNYKWSGVSGANESASLSFPWVINKAVLTKPTLTSDSFTYSGNETDVTRYLSGEYNADLMLLTGGRGVTAGEYGLRITLKNPDNYAWSGGGEPTLILPWRINKAQSVSAETADGLTYRVGGNLEYYDLKKMYSGGGNVKYTLTEGNDIAEISSGGMLIIKGAGKIVVTATILPDTNHEGGSVVLELTVKGKLSGGDTAMIITCSSGFASTIAAAIIIVINLNRKERF
jgi:hypothetical protein